jgi:predicted acetyltransferase
MISIRHFDFRKDWQEFCRLYLEVYGREVNKEYCDWKFLNNPFGEALGFGAWDQEKLIGFVAVWPMRFCLDGKEIISCAGGDTMVDISYRRQGLFTKLTLQLLEKMNQKIKPSSGWFFALLD